MTGTADKINENTKLTFNKDAVSAIGHILRLTGENEKLRAALQWLLNDLQDYPASARPIAAYDNARAALGEKG